MYAHKVSPTLKKLTAWSPNLKLEIALAEAMLNLKAKI